MVTPLVSVMVVAHDAERSLGVALASVLSQTIDDWECIVVDDGSAHPVEAHLESFHDTRFRYLRLDENRGRGHARQVGLDAARGRFLAILDADDWMYPARLEAELACLGSEPKAKVVGCSMLVEDSSHRILGVQQAAKPGPQKLGELPFSFAPILADMNVARAIGFDARLTRSEDVLFLTRVLEQPCACVSAPLYAYRPSIATRASTLEGYRCSRMAYSACRADHPLAARRLELSYRFRELVQGLSPEPLRQYITAWSRQRRLRPANTGEHREHAQALETVTRLAQSLGVDCQ